ncbi:WcaG Nucleoside-diphosphate-sugar epimerases [uncultured Caudovirales phage]|uniref:WcaG Nucleoside-diphosphate-sugar epimerases n=1 Tax=uncultured Caudovirales phage TaxID=2100421 RepID=A0A6J7WDP7_9CAUD|nr:WcaG Nucleoside-diphosphate-sugar epimerases [uncultured Caudovirales phage]CAB5208496.1 WcaG Nucleoside-diphosphate-sugar epimerases [uncultured Caudovirales phage]
MRILITGHEGFIGRNMLAWCQAEEGWQVDGYEWNPNERPEVSSYDWVIHLGAIADMTCNDVDSIMKQNLEFSQWLFNACNQHGVHLQYASSSSVYGNTKAFSEHDACHPQTPYAWSKYLFDRWVFQQEQHIYVQGFRYFNVYGRYMHLRGDRANAIHKWREQARKEGRITVWENAEHVKRDWTWVGDVCRLHIDFIKRVNGSGIWNCGSGLAHSFLDIAEEIAEQEGVDIEFVPVPSEELTRFRTKTQADLTLLKATVGKRKWLNVFEFLAE